MKFLFSLIIFFSLSAGIIYEEHKTFHYVTSSTDNWEFYIPINYNLEIIDDFEFIVYTGTPFTEDGYSNFDEPFHGTSGFYSSIIENTGTRQIYYMHVPKPPGKIMVSLPTQFTAYISQKNNIKFDDINKSAGTFIDQYGSTGYWKKEYRYWGYNGSQSILILLQYENDQTWFNQAWARGKNPPHKL